MEVTTTFYPRNRAEWRDLLQNHHKMQREIWLLLDVEKDQPNIGYLDAVEEALCFGWIDGIGKRYSPTQRAQRFTPRTRRSHWTELNKERVRRLIRSTGSQCSL